MRSLHRLLLTAALLLAGPLAAAGQIDPPVTDTVPEGPALLQASIDTASVTPVGAFLRAVAIPGWGHAAIGSHGRGGFYTAVQAANVWMLVKTRTRLGDAKELRGVRERHLRAVLAAAGEVDETRIQTALAADPEWASADGLVESRQQQFEDWLALTIFTVLLSGADALVSSHLQDFPQVTAAPVGDGGRMEVGVTFPLGGR